MKRGYRARLVAVAVAVAALLALILWPHEHEPGYQGRSLTDWLAIYSTNRGLALQLSPQEHLALNREGTDARNAVQQIGTNALPLLVKWMQYEPAKWRMKLAATLSSRAPWLGGRSFRRLIEGRPRSFLAVDGFQILGPEAAPAVPALTNLLRNWKSERLSMGVLRALWFVGEAGMPPLMAVATNASVPTRYRCQAVFRFRNFNLGTNTSWVVPALIACINDHPDITEQVALALGTMASEPALAVPALAKCLTNESFNVRFYAASYLPHFGKEARAAAPDLLKAINDADPRVREAARKALQNIAPEVLDKAPH